MDIDIDENKENSCHDTEETNNNEDNSNEIPSNKKEVWVKIESKKRYEVSILAENLPGKKPDEKIKNAYHIIDDASNIIGVKYIFIAGKKRVVATFKNKESADKACLKNILENNDYKFEKIIKRNENLDWQQRTIKIMDIPLNAKKDIIKNIFNKFGEVETISMRPSGMWYTALITFKSENTIIELQNTWSVSYFKDSMRIYPYKDYQKFYQQRNCHVLKLTNIPFGTTSYDLEDVITAVGGKTCFLARNKNSYIRTRIAYVAFENEELMANAMHTNYALREKELFWTTINAKTCHICGSPEHLAAKCEEKADRKEKQMKKQKFNGLSNPVKQKQLLETLKLKNINIVGITETKMSKKVASHALKNNDFEVWWSSNDKSPTSSGVGLMIKKSISIYVQKVKESNGRIIYADLFLPHQKIRIINVYINSSTSTEWDRKERLQTENETISIIEEGKKNNYSNIIIGDFNADPDKLELDRMNNKKIDRKYHLIKFLQNKNYIDIHTNIEDDKCYTWKNNNSTSRIDLIWMPNNMLDEVFFCETWKSPLYSSDHRMVITYLHKNNIIFNTKEANIKRKQMRRQVFSFDNMKEEDWLKYAETSDSLWKDSQMNKFKFPENPGHHDLNRILIMFLDQLRSYDGSYLLTWKEITDKHFI
ncbi:12051_t:CDS:2 [Entrophospora sp. SA101]|nr:12051_t:CDS:2 [Entrophospora sp. SA101]